MIVVLPSLIFAAVAVLAAVSLMVTWWRYGPAVRANLAALRLAEEPPAPVAVRPMQAGSSAPQPSATKRPVYRPLTPRLSAIPAGSRAAA
jgi:hypothetical protein